MSATRALVPFAAELVLFLASASLASVMFFRPDLVRVGAIGRALLSAAATMLGAAAILHGALIEPAADAPALTALRGGGAILLAAGVAFVHAPASRWTLAVAAGALAAGQALAGTPTASAVAVAVAGVAVAGTLALAARREIASRIAFVAGSLLLVVVLVLSGVLSTVLTGNVAREALQRVDARARTAAGIAEDTANRALKQAASIARSLEESPDARAAIRTGGVRALQERVERLASPDYRQVDFLALFTPSGRALARAGVDPATTLALAGSPVVKGAPAASVTRLDGGRIAGVGASPVRLPNPDGVTAVAGILAAGIRLDDALLSSLLGDEEGVNLSLVVPGGVAATTFARPPAELAAGVAGLFAEGTPVEARTRVDGASTFLAARPVTATDGTVVAALVVTSDGRLIDDTLASLFRTLFAVALGAAGLALAMAAAAGTWIGRPLRRLRAAAERISEGDLTARAYVRSQDEVGVLGESFDSMASSVERMTAEQRAAGARMEAIVSGMTEGLVATDADGVVVTVNPAAERLLRIPASAAVGREAATIVHGRDRSGVPFARHLARAGRPWSFGGYLEHEDGDLPVNISGAPIRGADGEVTGRLYVIRDMRSEHAVEQMKSEFLANISHELRTPLTPIRGYAEILRRRALPRRQAEAALGTIVESAERLERIINVLVSFAAIEAGRSDLGREPVDVGALVREVSGRWQPRAGGHAVEAEVGARLPRITAARRLLEDALEELVDNAVKYSPEGGRVTLRARQVTSEDGRFIEISVADRGIGIAPQDLERIFDEFRQLDGSSTRRFGGLGLGLSFVRRVARAHGGRLDVASERGKGSVFTLSLPVSARGAEAPTPRGLPETRPRPAGRGVA